MSFDPLRGPMKRSRNFYITVVSILMLILLGIGQNILDKRSIVQGKNVVMAPRFEVDPHWPKPLPNHWYIGMTIGVACDAQDHVWIDRKSTRLNSSHVSISYAVFCLKK